MSIVDVVAELLSEGQVSACAVDFPPDSTQYCNTQGDSKATSARSGA